LKTDHVPRVALRLLSHNGFVASTAGLGQCEEAASNFRRFRYTILNEPENVSDEFFRNGLLAAMQN